ncbi:Outer-membrane lipoprotein carrier protein precursor [Candidatus Gullanella endobia]|uniref:Outer-membrane lipoprotein carrier protein n=1 Tax=Candidatus Gullanella endobia TaxID=1070130 RepID=A0A143WRD0_9ENTR|nr:outer membrane lipoprotein chaperone LolA [Candidatus Gullanella endobia]CUX96278.1 Outer-membrane lipoprotein carrier protein precursor [Candidatus Gullanella endobia]
MKKWLITACLIAITTLPVSSTFADDANILKNRLNKINNFHAIFDQKVIDSEGRTIQEGKGEFWIKRPNLFNCHMTSPDEIMLISDGKTLWFYNAFIEQATANWLKNETGNTPFIFIIRNNPADWKQYNIKHHGNNFLIVPKDNKNNLKQFTINITANGAITSFATLEKNGQYSSYKLKRQNNTLIQDSKFHFILPKGVILDDQRQ